MRQRSFCGGCSRSARVRGAGARAELSEPHRHHHRAVSGRRTDRSARARAGPGAVREARAEFHRRERQRRRHHHRDRSGRTRAARRPHAAPAQSADFGQRRRSTPICRSTPRRTSTPVIFINNNPLVLVGRKTLAAQHAAASCIAAMKTQRDEDGASRHRRHRPPRHLPARAGGEGRRSITSRIAARRRRCRTSPAGMSTCSSPRRNRWCSKSRAGR